MNNVGQQLKKARIQQVMEHQELASRSGVDLETIKAIEEGRLDVGISTLYQLSRALNWVFTIGDVSI
jgi:transcriptional regulator with XRE-family HTH domain